MCTKTALFRRSIFLTPQSSNFCQFVCAAQWTQRSRIEASRTVQESTWKNRETGQNQHGRAREVRHADRTRTDVRGPKHPGLVGAGCQKPLCRGRLLLLCVCVWGGAGCTTTPSMQLLSALHAQDELHERAWQRGERGASGRAIGQEASVRAGQQQRCQLSEERTGSNFAAPVQGGWFAAEDR